MGLEVRGMSIFEPGALSCSHWPSGALEAVGRCVSEAQKRVGQETNAEHNRQLTLYGL